MENNEAIQTNGSETVLPKEDEQDFKQDFTIQSTDSVTNQEVKVESVKDEAMDVAENAANAAVSLNLF